VICEREIATHAYQGREHNSIVRLGNRVIAVRARNRQTRGARRGLIGLRQPDVREPIPTDNNSRTGRADGRAASFTDERLESPLRVIQVLKCAPESDTSLPG